MKELPEDGGLCRRRLMTGGAVMVLGCLAGCSSFRGSIRAPPEEPIEYVPASASLVIDVDMAVTESAETRRLVEAAADEGAPTLFEKFESRTGLALARTREVVGFSAAPRPPRTPFIVDAEYDEAAAVGAIESAHGTEYEQSDLDVGTMYVPASGEAEALGVAAREQYVYGTESEVETALRVFAGEASALDGPLRDAVADVSAAGEQAGQGTGTGGTATAEAAEARTEYVSGATDQPLAYLPDEDDERIPAGVSFDLYEKVETAGATYFVADGEIGIEIELRTPGEAVAGDVADFTRTLATFAEAKLENRTVAREFGKVDVSQDDVMVTVVYRSDVEGAAALVGWL